MTVRAWLARHLAAACVLGFASIASAQITTGAITGTVRDGQGGVIPGATVILTSDTQGTKSSPVVTDANGDFVFVNLRADTYTIEVSMPSFSTLKRAGLQVSPGERLSAGSLVIEVGRHDRGRRRQGRSADRAVELRGTVLHDCHGRGRPTCRLPAAPSPSLRRWRRASPVPAASATGPRPEAATPTFRWTACPRWTPAATGRSST